ncbi:enoyl-CoA hydratase [Hydrogenophaga sp. BPS33]|nr:enoyl-CoA hydratase [Hydrogenophaga sp. BPS33]
MQTSPDSMVLLNRQDGVATLSLNRPAALNALNVPLAEALLAACREIAEDGTTRAVILRGEGRSFGVGGDLAALRDGGPDTPIELIGAMHESIKILSGLDAPVIASLHGAVAGGSLSLSLACDLAIAAEGTKFNLAYANVAASCDVSGSWNLPRVVGLRRALEIALLCETFDAAEALRLGIVNRVVPADRLGKETLDLARRLAAGPTRAYGRIKKLMRQSSETAFPNQLDAERDAFDASARTDDFKEALAAFFNKRAPTFQGR